MHIILYAAAALGACVLAGVFVVEVVLRVLSRFAPIPVPPIVTVLIDNPLRRRLEPPAAVVRAAALGPGMKVLEVGPGHGTYTVPVAAALGPGGELHAVDLQPGVIVRLEKRLRRDGVANVKTYVANAYELPFPAGFFDRAVMVTALGEVPDRERALREVARVLNDGGLLVVGELLPDPDYLTPRRIISWGGAAGFEAVAVERRRMSHVTVLRKKAEAE